jgi:hypothetical protein
MKPAKLDLPTIWRGCDWGPVTLKWKNVNGTPINLDAWRPIAYSLNINLNAQKSTTEVGTTTIRLLKSQTLHLKLGVENWDWIWQTENGSYRFPPFLAGKVAVKDPVTSVNGDTLPGIPDDTERVEQPPLPALPS